MGMDIGWYRLTGDKFKTKWAGDVPEEYTMRFTRRGLFVSLIYDVPYEHHRTCSCPEGDKHNYFCDDIGVVRPTDFAAFREKLKAEGMLEPDEEGFNIFNEMVDWLEKHPDVYVEFS
jgi:hypothetical protein